MNESRRDRFILIAAVLLVILPFVNRPVFVDDHSHILAARELLTHPSDPFHTNGTGLFAWQSGGSPIEANPLLYFYLIGFFMKLAGTALWKAHLFMVPFHLVAILSFYELARRYVKRPLEASLLWLSTAQFWLTANSLLLDAMIAPFLIAGIYFWIRGWEKIRSRDLGIGALALGLAALVKYTAVLGWAVAILWTILEGKSKRSWRWLFLLIPFGLFGAWLGWTQSLYHESHIEAVAKASMVIPSAMQVLILCAFTAGTATVLALAVFPAICGHTRQRLVSLMIFLVAVAIGNRTGLPYLIGLQVGAWAGFFFVWIYVVASTTEIVTARSGQFLLSWVLLGLIGLAVARDWFCARYFVVIGAPLVTLTVSLLENSKTPWLSSPIFLRSAVVFFLATTGLLAFADQQQARVDKLAAMEMNAWAQADGLSRKHYYPGAILSGLSYYLDQNLWTPAQPNQEIEKGAIVVVPWRSLPGAFFPHISNPSYLKKWIYTIPLPLRTLDTRSYAGFYGSIWGPLPFSFSTAPAEVYTLIESK